MRTIQEIKDSMTATFISNETVFEKYGLQTGKTFEEQFSKVSLESILFYVFACCVWSLEAVFTQHKKDIDAAISEKKPHSVKWYRNKVLDFRFGQNLIDDSDQYSNANLSPEDMEKKKIVKYAAVKEAADASKLYVKVAGELDGQRAKLNKTQEDALIEYLNVVRDAGVNIEIVNKDADRFYLTLDIYYNPMILSSDGSRVDAPNVFPVVDTIKQYIGNLPFNGEYKNISLADLLQDIDGVEIPEIKSAQHTYGIHEKIEINARCTPDAGYMKVYDLLDLNIKYIANESRL